MRIPDFARTRWTSAALVAVFLGLAPVLAPAPVAVVHADEPDDVAASDEMLIGTWEIDGEATLDAMGLTLTPEQQLWLSQQIQAAGLRVVFRRDGTATVTDAGGASGLPWSSNWATVSTDGARIAVLLLDAAQSDGAAPQTITIDFNSQRRLVLSVDSQPLSFVMTRGATAPGDTAAAPVAGVGVTLPELIPHPITGDPVTAADETNLHGTWVADMNALMLQEAANMAPEQVAMMHALMGNMEITFTFVDDGTAVMRQNAMGQSETKNGAWVFETATANTVTFVLTETPAPGEPQEPTQRFTATFESTNNMTLSMEGDPQLIPFYRQ
jgi:hypothetical protein